MHPMRAASRRALAEARERLDGYLDGAAEADADQLGDELFSVADVLVAEVALRRHLADPATGQDSRVRLLTSVLGKSVRKPAVDVLTGLVLARWSRPLDLVAAVETLAQLAVLDVAQQQGAVENVEDELFRVGRLVDREPRLRALLADLGAPVDQRVELLRAVLAGKVHPVTERLLVRAVRSPQGRNLDRAAEELAELAAARRERTVAKVATPVALTDAQQERLTTALSRIYRRQITLQVELRPELLGGLVVRVGDEVIDGSIAGRLVAANQGLPH